MVEGCERQTYAGLATHLVKIAQKALKDCDMSALIESFEGFEQRRLKDLANAPSETESDEEDAHDEDVVARVLFCLQAVVVNTAQCTLSSEQCSAFCKGSRRQLRSHIDVLTQVVELLQAMIEEPCGEALYAFAIQTMASCVPIYGRMGLFVDQVRIARSQAEGRLQEVDRDGVQRAQHRFGGGAPHALQGQRRGTALRVATGAGDGGGDRGVHPREGQREQLRGGGGWL